MTFLITTMRDWYGRYERPVSSLSLIGGFVFDALTLKRVDLFWENIWVIVHLVVVAICIILINLQENEAMDDKDASKAHFWYINILQFFFGGLLSTFIVFYFRSATLSVTWPFLLLLAGAFVANERLKKHYARLVFQISLFYVSLLSFSIFIVPVLFHQIGTVIFLISGAVSLIILWLFFIGLAFFAKEKFVKSKKMLMRSVLGIFFAINILYFFNLIPPIPLSLKDGGVYHSLEHDASGNYVVASENTGWLRYFSLHEQFHWVAGSPVYVYSAVFSPTSFATRIVHEWQKYDANTREWKTVSRIPISVFGGRDGGYRTYSMKNNVSSGEWRVNVETLPGQIIGRLRFTVIATDTEPAISSRRF